MGDDDQRLRHLRTLEDLLECYRAWEPDVRILGNVRAEDAAEALVFALASLKQGDEMEER